MHGRPLAHGQVLADEEVEGLEDPEAPSAASTSKLPWAPTVAGRHSPTPPLGATSAWTSNFRGRAAQGDDASQRSDNRSQVSTGTFGVPQTASAARHSPAMGPCDTHALMAAAHAA